jgi:hypothetical protein
LVAVLIEGCAALAAVSSVVVAVVAVLVAVRTAKEQQVAARQQLRATAWGMIAQLDAIMREYGAERSWVNGQAKKPAETQQCGRDRDHDISGYMGVFERLDELLETGLISDKVAHAFYGSRLRKLLKTIRARKILAQRPEGWTSFISLSLRLDDYGRRKNKAVIVVQASDAEPQPTTDEDYRKQDKRYRTILEASLCKLAGDGDQDAAWRLAGLLAKRGDLDGLRARADDTGDENAARQLAERGDLDGLRVRADAGDWYAAEELAGLLAKRGDLDRLRARAEAGDQHATRQLARLLAERGDKDKNEAAKVLRRADAGDWYSAWQLAGLLAERGDLDGLRARADAGDQHAACQLARLLAEQSDKDEAAMNELRARADVGDRHAALALACARQLPSENRYAC